MPLITATAADHVRQLPADRLPAYLYDLTALRTHAAAVRAVLPDRVELHYAAKANPEPALLRALRDHVDGYEVSSGGELAHVRAAVPDAPLAFGGPGKTDAEIAAALAAGVHRWHVESVAELHRLAARTAARPPAAPPEVLLRVNLPVAPGQLAGVPLAMGGRPTPFGLDPADLPHCLHLLGTEPFAGLRLRGFHFHLASGLDAPDQLALSERIVAWATELARSAGRPLTELNLGGGMAVDYERPTARFDWTGYGAGLAALLDRHPGLRLRIEPGRALTAYCGWYATEVLDVKRSHGEEFAVLRGGTHHLRTPATRGHSQPFTVLPVAAWPHPWPRPAAGSGRATLCGQLCTPKDALAHRAPVGTLRAGDRVAFALAGAYAWNISHHDFLMHPHPSVHVLP
ncbi:type III PLP-dependent enzyme [Kitasatospora sp. NPDC058965]|uniref:type III PLP-dependent enzyme n=1 Tax=Kitasatospora sp. NPDC058965 TaxID=3346682 RepID=UPI0036D0ECAD